MFVLQLLSCVPKERPFAVIGRLYPKMRSVALQRLCNAHGECQGRKKPRLVRALDGFVGGGGVGGVWHP